MRRHRRHVRDDHSLCRPESCERAPGARPPETPPEPLQREGQELLDELAAADLSPLGRRLALEAARVVDRLTRLDAVLRGEQDEWVRLVPASPDGSQVRVVVTGVMAEARQQAMTLRALAAEIRASTPVGAPAGEVDPLDELAAARAARLADTAGS